jgi:hypothetical protein
VTYICDGPLGNGAGGALFCSFTVLGAIAMAEPTKSPAATDKADEPRSLHKREVLWAIAIILGLAAAPSVGSAYTYYVQTSPVEGLYDAALTALQHSPEYAQSLGCPIEPRMWTREVVNYPSPTNDGRVKFFVSTPSGDTQILARGRFEDGHWQLTYLEVQPMVGMWFIDGELGGFQREGRLKPIEI